MNPHQVEKIQLVKTRLTAWAENAEFNLRRCPPGPEETMLKNKACNYRTLVLYLQEAIDGEPQS